MNEFEDAVLLGIDAACLVVSLAAPEEEYHSILLLVDHRDHMVRELLPAFLLVRVGDALADCQDSIEEQDPLSRPLGEVSVDGVRHLKVHLTIVVKCLVDVFQTWRALNVLGDREAKTHGLAIFDVGILSHDDYFQLGEGHVVERVKDQVLGREDGGL